MDITLRKMKRHFKEKKLRIIKIDKKKFIGVITQEVYECKPRAMLTKEKWIFLYPKSNKQRDS
jgi:hypothetical protein